MNLLNKILDTEVYTYKDYKLLEGNWELIQGHPQSISPSTNHQHQRYSAKFSRSEGNLIEKENCTNCNCEVLYEIGWIVNNNTLVRPDCIIICGEVNTEFIIFPPTLILEIASHSTRLKDRNTKFNLYEMAGVKYYIIADIQKKFVEVFELTDNKYKQTDTTTFVLTRNCSIILDVFNLWL